MITLCHLLHWQIGTAVSIALDFRTLACAKIVQLPFREKCTKKLKKKKSSEATQFQNKYAKRPDAKQVFGVFIVFVYLLSLYFFFFSF